MKELWTKDEAEFHGRYYDFPPVYCYPKPVQKPHPPVLLGGNAPNVLQRVARWGDGWLPTRVSPAQVEEGRKILDTLAVERGRDPASLTISVFGQPPETDRDQIEAFLNAGAERVSCGPRTARPKPRWVSNWSEWPTRLSHRKRFDPLEEWAGSL